MNKYYNFLILLVLIVALPVNNVKVYAINQGGNTIYTDFRNGQNDNTGNGTLGNPYNLLSTALQNANDGDIIVILNEAFLNDVNGSGGAPLIIDKDLTIKGEGSQRRKLQTRMGGIILGANFKLENIELQFDNKVRDHIFANGHELILDNVVVNSSSREIDIFGGTAYVQGSTTPQQGYGLDLTSLKTANTGSKSKITINASENLNKFGKIYAGSLNGVSNIPVEITLNTQNSSYFRQIQGISLVGADQAPTGGMLDPTEPPTPAENPAYTVNSEVTLNLNGYYPKTGIDGQYTDTVNVNVISGTYSTNINKLININSLKAENEVVLASKGELTFKGNDKKIILSNENTTLDLKEVKDKNIIIDSFDGGGKIRLPLDGSLEIKNGVTGNTGVYLGGWGTNSDYIANKDKTYIKAQNSVDNSFELIGNQNNNPTYRLVRQSNGEWKIQDGSQPPVVELPSFNDASIVDSTLTINLNKNLPQNFDNSDKSDFVVLVNNLEVGISNISGNTSSGTITLTLDEKTYIGDSVNVEYTGSKVKQFDSKVTNNSTNNKPTPPQQELPSFSNANIIDDTLTINLNKNLPQNFVDSDKSDFTVLVDSSEVGISNVSGNTSSNTITLILDEKAYIGDSVNVQYKGSKVKQFNNAVTNNSTGNKPTPPLPPQDQKPSLISGSFDNNTVTLNFNKTLNGIDILANEFFITLNNDGSKKINVTSVNTNGTTLKLSLAEQLNYGDTIRLTYNGKNLDVTNVELKNTILMSYKKIFIDKNQKNIIKILLEDNLKGSLNISDFTVTKNGIDTINIKGLNLTDNTIELTLAENLLPINTYTVSYVGNEFNKFMNVDVENNIKTIITGGSIDDSYVITLKTDEALKENITNINDFNVFKNIAPLSIKSVKGNIGKNSIQVTLNSNNQIYKGDNITLSYIGTQLEEISNLKIQNNITKEPIQQKAKIKDIYTNSGYVDNNIIVKLDTKLDSALSKDYVQIKSKTRKDYVIKNVETLGDTLNITLENNINYKDNISLIITANNLVQDNNLTDIKNNTFNLGGFDVTEDGNIILSDGRIFEPINKNKAPELIGNYNIRLSDGGIITEDSYIITLKDTVELTNTSSIKVGEDKVLQNNTITFTDGNKIIANKGDILLDSSSLILENGGLLEFKDVTTKTLDSNKKLYLNDLNKDEDSKNNSQSNINYNSGGGAVIGSSNNTSNKENTNINTESNTEEKTNINTPNTTIIDNINHWSNSSIVKLVDANIIANEMINDEFIKLLDTNINRGEFTKLIYNLLKENYHLDLEVSNKSFSDLTNTDIETKNAILSLVSSNILSGYTDGTFKPNSSITREEMAVILDRTLNLINLDNINSYIINDLDSTSAWSKASIEKLSSLGIIRGDNNGNFLPKSNLTYAQSYSAVCQLLNQN
mgnify:CR=1 FL=1